MAAHDPGTPENRTKETQPDEPGAAASDEAPAGEALEPVESPPSTPELPAEAVVLDPDTGEPIGEIVIAAKASLWAGPLPSPDALEAYERVRPGLAERLVKRFEIEAEHRESLERTVVEAGVENQRTGQNRAFIIVMTVIIGGFVAIGLGWEYSGLASILSSLALLAGVFVYTRWRGSREVSDSELLRGDE